MIRFALVLCALLVSVNFSEARCRGCHRGHYSVSRARFVQHTWTQGPAPMIQGGCANGSCNVR